MSESNDDDFLSQHGFSSKEQEERGLDARYGALFDVLRASTIHDLFHQHSDNWKNSFKDPNHNVARSNEHFSNMMEASNAHYLLTGQHLFTLDSTNCGWCGKDLS